MSWCPRSCRWQLVSAGIHVAACSSVRMLANPHKHACGAARDQCLGWLTAARAGKTWSKWECCADANPSPRSSFHPLHASLLPLRACVFGQSTVDPFLLQRKRMGTERGLTWPVIGTVGVADRVCAVGQYLFLRMCVQQIARIRHWGLDMFIHHHYQSSLVEKLYKSAPLPNAPGPAHARPACVLLA